MSALSKWSVNMIEEEEAERQPRVYSPFQSVCELKTLLLNTFKNRWTSAKFFFFGLLSPNCTVFYLFLINCSVFMSDLIYALCNTILHDQKASNFLDSYGFISRPNARHTFNFFFVFFYPFLIHWTCQLTGSLYINTLAAYVP